MSEQSIKENAKAGFPDDSVKRESNPQLLEFLFNSINDIQGTIRAIDAKVSFLLVLIVLPLGNIDEIVKYVITPIRGLDSGQHYSAIFGIVLFIGWLLSLGVALITLVAIDNPANHIDGKDEARGYFYCPGLFGKKKNTKNEEKFSNIGIIDVFVNRKSIMSRKSLSTYLKEVEGEKEIIKELKFEQMKLAYIRDIKMVLQKWCFLLTAAWFVIGIILCLIANKCKIATML